MGNQLIKVLVVDNHAMVRKGIKAFLSEYEDIRVVGEADNGSGAIELVKRLKPDVVLIDPPRPGVDGAKSIESIVAVQPNHPVIVVTAYPANDAVIPAMNAGATGYLLKDAQTEELVRVIRSACSGAASLYGKFAPISLHGMNSKESSRRSGFDLDGQVAV
jgi:two-component system, NarL family, response regulator LiaR